MISLTLSGLVTFPPFIRFDSVQLSYLHGKRPIEAKCEFIGSYLLTLKSALNCPNMVKFCAGIDQNDGGDFSDHLQLCEFIRNRLLPIFCSSQRYNIKIYLYSDKNSVANVIASLLQMDGINASSSVEIEIINGEQNQFPLEAISNWLVRSADRTGNIARNKKERLLEINFYNTIQNAHEMIDHLKTVFISFLTILIRLFNGQLQKIRSNQKNFCSARKIQVKIKRLYNF